MYRQLVFVSVVFGLAAGVRAAPFRQDSGPAGLVVMEAENYDENVAQGVHTWELVTNPAGYSGSGAMRAMPDSGSLFNDPADYLVQSPRLDFEVEFVKSGTHYVWVRSYQTNDATNSCHVGLNGQHNPTSDRVGNQTTVAWVWNGTSLPDGGARLTIDIPSPGVYTINVWMREDGYWFDKIVLTTDEAYTPTDEGPAESPRTPPELASSPTPKDEQTDVLRDTVLSWLPGEGAASHDVYFGTSFEDVNTATRAEQKDVLLSPGQSETTYDPGVLGFGQTYYWRVDEVQGGTFHTGRVWSFTVEPWAYPLPESVITISASVPNDVTSPDPNVLIDGSGIDADGNHSTDADEMWLGSGAAPVSVTLTLDQIYKLNEITIWNLNSDAGVMLGFGFNDAVVDYSVDGQTWITAVETQLTPGTGLEPVAGETLPLGDIDAQYVRITANNNQMGLADLYGLSEIQLAYVPVRAREPQPAPGAEDVDPSVVLGWRTGRQAATHQVHVGLDPNAVAAGDALVDAVAGTSYDTSALGLLLGEKYYWMITEVNEAETPSAWDSPVWDFNTADILVVDDMESYNDSEGSRIFEVWMDGYGVMSNGSLVGNDIEPFAEEDIVHGDDQSMPFRYGEDGATTSEATLTLDAPMNWTRSGIQTLVIWFRGSLGNATGQLYLKVNGGAPVNYTGSMGSLAAPVWKQWNIDVASLGNAAQNVTSVTLGVSATGKGRLYFDDIALYREAEPQTGGAADPGTANLMALYSMENNANDESGHGYNGTAETGSSFGTGPSGYGRAVVLDGTSGHVTLPIGPLVQTLSSATFATWVNWTGSGSAWCRIFDFGTGEAVNMFLTPNAGNNPTGLRFAITAGGAGGESQLNMGSILPGGWQHVAVTIDEATSQMALYVNGSVVDDGDTGVLPSALGNTTQNYLGRSQYAADPYLPGSLDDFRIYSRALSAEEIRYLVGDR